MSDRTEIVGASCTALGLEQTVRHLSEFQARRDIEVTVRPGGIRLCVGVDRSNGRLPSMSGTCMTLSSDQAAHVANLLLTAAGREPVS